MNIAQSICFRKKMEFSKLQYIGSKYRLLDFVVETMRKRMGRDFRGKTIGDLFSGTAVCSLKFRMLGAQVITNDLEYYAYVMGRGFSRGCLTPNVEERLEEINELEGVDGLVTRNYSPMGGRMFFTVENAQRIDASRQYLEGIRADLQEDEYYYVLSTIMMGADRVANVASVYGAYLKRFKPSAKRRFEVVPMHRLRELELNNEVLNEDANSAITGRRFDAVYLDPPYNARQYSKNYHVLNFIAQYVDQPTEGVAGLLQRANLSRYCRKREVKETLEDLLERVNAEWVFMSYNSESLLKREEVVEMMEKHGEVWVEQRSNRRFQSQVASSKQTVEYIFCLRKRS